MVAHERDPSDWAKSGVYCDVDCFRGASGPDSAGWELWDVVSISVLDGIIWIASTGYGMDIAILANPIR